MPRSIKITDPLSHSGESLASPGCDMSHVATIILGGGKGTRLFPLTQNDCKPAISFGGRYKLIDVPISNSLNSGCNKIFILSQFLSASLHHHIFHTYRQDTVSKGFLEILSAEQRHSQSKWYEGTADAIRQNLQYLVDIPAEYFLILSGDQLYKMDFRHMFQFALQTDADLVIAALPITREDAPRMGILKINSKNFITEFCEKPQDELLLERLISHHQNPYQERPYLGSMGIYLFKREALFNLLKNDAREDFGKHLIPTKVSQGNTAAYLHDGYWEDIGTVGSFFKANMTLTQKIPSFNCHEEDWPIFSFRHHLPGAKIHDTKVIDSIVCEGSIVEADLLENTILGPRSYVRKGSIIRQTYALGNDFYHPPHKRGRIPHELHIGKNCLIQKAILDKHVYLGDNVQLVNKNKLDHYDGDQVYIRDGIIVVPRGAILKEGFVL